MTRIVQNYERCNDLSNLVNYNRKKIKKGFPNIKF